MDLIVPDALSKELIPVWLGFSAESLETARRMYRTYGIGSHIFCDKVPLPFRISVSAHFHIIPHTVNEHLMFSALIDFAKQYAHADVILCLLPCTEEYISMIWNFQKELEGHYVLAKPSEVKQFRSGMAAPALKEKHF